VRRSMPRRLLRAFGCVTHAALEPEAEQTAREHELTRQRLHRAYAISHQSVSETDERRGALHRKLRFAFRDSRQVQRAWLVVRACACRWERSA
jgi:hypothetical protein